MTEPEGRVRRWTLYICTVCGGVYTCSCDGYPPEEQVEVIEAAPVEELVEALERIADVADKSLAELGVYKRPDLSRIARAALAPFTEDTDHDA